MIVSFTKNELRLLFDCYTQATEQRLLLTALTIKQLLESIASHNWDAAMLELDEISDRLHTLRIDSDILDFVLDTENICGNIKVRIQETYAKARQRDERRPTEQDPIKKLTFAGETIAKSGVLKSLPTV